MELDNRRIMKYAEGWSWGYLMPLSSLKEKTMSAMFKRKVQELHPDDMIELSGDIYADPANEGIYDARLAQVSQVSLRVVDGEEVAVVESVYEGRWVTLYFPLDHVLESTSPGEF